MTNFKTRRRTRRTVIEMRRYVLYILLLVVGMMAHANRIAFEQLPEAERARICTAVLDCMTNAQISCCAFVPSEFDRLSSSWDLTYPRDTFAKMKFFSLHPTRILWAFPETSAIRFVADQGRDPCYVYLNEEELSEILMRRDADLRTGRYAPLLGADEKFLCAFVRSQKTPLYHDRSAEVLYPALAADYRVDVASCKLWETSTFSVVSNCAFRVEVKNYSRSRSSALSSRQRSLLERRQEVSRLLVETSPPVTLSRLEATEVVYVTALCRKKVSSLAEFNEKIVKGDTAGFMVDVKNPVCETAIGSHLYQAAKRGNLIVSPQEKE